jgi:membrane protease YdiL (CAAX protease family)
MSTSRVSVLVRDAPSAAAAAVPPAWAGLPLYVAGAFGVTWLFWGLAALSERGLLALLLPTDLLMLLGGLGPMLAAIGVAAQRSGRAGVRALLGQLLRWRVGPVWYAVALLAWPAVDVVLVLLNVAAGGALPTAPPASLWLAVPGLFVRTVLFGGGLYEEIGWRGFALPRLQERYGALAASLGLGLVWALWHLPLWFVPGQEMPPFALFVPNVVALSVVLAWLYNATGGSLLIVALAHTANNVAFRVFGQVVAAMPADGLRVGPLLTDVAVPVAMIVLVALLTDPRTLTHRPRRVPGP